jgi:hypothetical protein
MKHEDRIKQLVYAALYLVYLRPAGPARVHTLSQVVELLRACPERAVRTLVGEAGHKRLYNLLSKRFMLPPLSSPRSSTGVYQTESLDFLKQKLKLAYDWAEYEELPIIPLNKIAEVAPGALLVAELLGHLKPHERDMWTMSVYLDRYINLPQNVRDAVERTINLLERRMAKWDES